MNKVQMGALGAAVACVIAGCRDLTPAWFTVGPDYERPEFSGIIETMPDAGWSDMTPTAPASTNAAPAATNAPAAAAKPVVDPRLEITHDRLVSWWTQFNDPILAQLVENAISNNLSFKMAQYRLVQARWGLVSAGSSLLPHLNGNAGWTRAESHRNNSESQLANYEATGVRGTHGDTFNAGFDASWEIDVFGGSRRGVEAAVATMDAAECSVEDAWVSLTAEIASQYITLRTVQDRLNVARTNLKLQSETYDILKSRLDSGIGDELAVNQSRYVVEQTRAAIPTLLDTEEQLKNAIAVLAGAMPGTLHPTLGPATDRDWLLAPQKISSVPMNVMRARPDVRAAERKLAAQVAYVGVATSRLYPKLYMNGTLGLESVRVQKFLSPGSLYSSIGPAVSWPLFQGGNVTASIRTEEAKMDEAVCAYQAAIQNAYRETRDAYSSYTQEYSRFKALQAAVKAAKDAETISKDLYKNGLADFNNVLDAQRSLLTYEESLTVSRGQITVKLIALYKALGGGLAL